MNPVALKSRGKVPSTKVTQIRSGVAASVFDFDGSESDDDVSMTDGAPGLSTSSVTTLGDLSAKFSALVQHIGSICNEFEAVLRDADEFVSREDFPRAILSWKRALALFQRYESLVGEVAIVTSRCDVLFKGRSAGAGNITTTATLSGEVVASVGDISHTVLPQPSTYTVVLCEYIAQAYLHLATRSPPSRSDELSNVRNAVSSPLTGQQSRWLLQALAAADEGLQWTPTSYAHLLSTALLNTPLALSMGIRSHAQAAVDDAAASQAPSSSAADPHTAPRRTLMPGHAYPWLWLMKAHCLLHLNRVADAVVAAGRARDAIQSWEDAALPSDAAAQGAVRSPMLTASANDAIGARDVGDDHGKTGDIHADVVVACGSVTAAVDPEAGVDDHIVSMPETIVCPRSGQVWPRLQGTQATRYRDVESMLLLAQEEYRTQMATHQRALREYQLRSHGNTMLVCPDFERCCDAMQRETRYHLIHGYTIAEGEQRREDNKLEAEQLLRRR